MKTTEKMLIRPALTILSEPEFRETGISTSELARLIRQRITPSAEDLELLKGRVDDRLSQVIRNLVSHRTLQKMGYADFVPSPTSKDGKHRVTPRGLLAFESGEPRGDTPRYK